MATCKFCGELIDWRTVDGKSIPIHQSGGWQCGGREIASGTSDICFCTACPYNCGHEVWFIRYNGGCVWVDTLGHPWPKHVCCEKVPEPSWWPIVRRQGERGRSVEDAVRSLKRGEFDSQLPPACPARASRVHPNVPGAEDDNQVVRNLDGFMGLKKRKIWVVYDNYGTQVASFEFRDRSAAENYRAMMTAETGNQHYLDKKDVFMDL